MTDRKTASTINDLELDALYAELDRLTAELADYDQRVQQLTTELKALRAVARGYCPDCGRGDAAPTVADWEQQRQRAGRAEAAIARVREYAATSDDDGIRTRETILRIVGDWPGPETEPAPTAATQPTGFIPFAPPHIPRTGDPSRALVVEPYRNDRGDRAWVFRCWGVGACDGWLSLDHYSQQSAERARDRHVAEAHTDHQPTEC